MNMQKQKPIWSKILAMLCALALCISMVPAASAAPGGGSTTSSVSKVTMTKGDGIRGFATYSTDIGNQTVTDGSVKYRMADNTLEVTSASSDPLPLAITFYAQADYQPTITSSNDGVSAIASNYGGNWWMITISLANATANEVTLNAEAVPTYTVTFDEKGSQESKGYTLIKVSSDTVKKGESYQFYVIPKTGYQAPEVTVTRGVSDTGSNPETILPSEDGTGLYTVSDIQSDIMITIGKASAKTYTVTFPTGDEYTIKSTSDDLFTDNQTTVNHGENVSFKVVANENYNLNNIAVYAGNTRIEEKGGVYTISQVTEDMTVLVVGVQKNTYQVTWETGTGYSITSNQSTAVEAGGNFIFTVTPAAGYTITKVTADDQKLTPENNQYSIKVNQNTTIKVTATATQYPVNVTALNATVEVNDQAIGENYQAFYGNLTFTVTPEAGYKVDSVTYNGATLPKSENGEYTISVTAPVEIVVTTSPLVNVTLTTTVTATGNATYTIVVKTFPGAVTGNSDDISVVGYGTLYSNESFISKSLKDVILGLTLQNTLTQQQVSNDPVVYSYGKKVDFHLDQLKNTFSYTFNNSSSKDRYGAGWIKLSDGQNSWIVFSDTVPCQQSLI